MRTLLLASLLGLASTAQAQYVFKEYDINPGGDANPKELTIMNGRLYFTATTIANGLELFSTTGVHPNLSIVADIRSGGIGSDVANLTLLGSSKLIFSADDGSGKAVEVWQSDGSSGGTSLLKDVFAGGVSSTPMNFKSFNGKVYFGAFGSGGGDLDLWTTDGTTAGTQLLKDINPTGGSYPEGYLEANGKLYFTALTDLEGAELWVTDGTDTGTKMIKDIIGGIQGATPVNKFSIGNKIFFEGCCAPPPFGTVIYESDGTALGTKVFSEPGLNKLNKDFIIPWKNKVYFDGGSLAPGMLWYTDGTLAGTDSIAQIGIAGWPAVYKDKLYFAGSTPGSGIELMVSDGTKAGTKVLADIIAGPDGSSPSYLTVYENKLYFIAQTSLGDTQLYVSDGTDTGTRKVINPFATQSNPLSVTAFNGFKEMDGKLYFGAIYSGNGAELWSLEDTSTPVGITQVVNTPNIELFPNPAGAVCNVLIDNAAYQKGSIQLCDMKGSVIKQQQLTAGQRQAAIQLNNIAVGVYTVKVDIDGNIVNRKLVVQ
jgi:ELWxxDGT repeat protein